MSQQQPTEQHGFEFFPTPREAIMSLLECELAMLPRGGRWLEPSVGSGRIVSTVREVLPEVQWTTVDIDERFSLVDTWSRAGDEVLWGDFLERSWPPGTFDVTITNPPFALARRFVEHAFRFSLRVVMLQRAAWFKGTTADPKRASESPPRDAFFRRHCPDRYTLPERPSFTPDGKQDNAEYDWFDWPFGAEPRRIGRALMLDRPRTTQLTLGGL